MKFRAVKGMETKIKTRESAGIQTEAGEVVCDVNLQKEMMGVPQDAKLQYPGAPIQSSMGMGKNMFNCMTLSS